MAYYYYGYDYPLALVDHMHERTHQHRTPFQSLTHQKPRPEDYPNQPDVDMRDGIKEYLIEVEVPGVKSADELHVNWTTTQSVIVSGDVARPDEDQTEQHPTGANDPQGQAKQPKAHMMVGERRIGPFRRIFHFPTEVDEENMSAKLEAGLLKIRVPKKAIKHSKGGKVAVEG
jgi:HSP20 family molecular chaperone IbpA